MLVAARRTGLGQVRAYLAADLLRRWSERAGLAPTVIDLLPDGAAELRAACADLNIHPPRHTLTRRPRPASWPGSSPTASGSRSSTSESAPPGSLLKLAGPPQALAPHWIEVADADGAETTAGAR